MPSGAHHSTHGHHGTHRLSPPAARRPPLGMAAARRSRNHDRSPHPVLDPTGCGVSSVYRSRRVVKNGARVIALDSQASGIPTRNSTTAMIFTGVGVPGSDLTIT